MEEYRIKYNAGLEHSESDNYHYYMADSAIQALNFHELSRQAKKISLQTISVERFCRYSEKWILEMNQDEVTNRIDSSD